MKRFLCIGLATLCALATSVDVTAQGVPAVERGTAAAASAIRVGQDVLRKESELLSRRLATQRENEKGRAEIADIHVEVPQNIAEYFKWSKEQAAIRIWPGDEVFGVTYGTFTDRIGVGSMGFVPRVNIVQVIDDNSARVDLKWFTPEKWKVSGPAGEEFYKLGERRLENVIVHMPTAGLVDDAEYRLGKVLEITGTERYTTITGAMKTVFELRSVNVERYRAAFDESERVIAAKDAAAKEREVVELERQKRLELEKSLTRTWTDPTGKFAVKGILIEIMPGPKAKIKREDGATIEVEFFKLSKADRAWISDEGRCASRKAKDVTGSLLPLTNGAGVPVRAGSIPTVHRPKVHQ